MTQIRELLPPKEDQRVTAATGDRYLGLLKALAGILVVLLVVGYLPTARLAGEQGVVAMVAGCGVSLMGSVAGTVPFLLSRNWTPVESMPVLLGSMALRIVVVVALAAAAALTFELAIKPFLIWVAISHAGLLVADTSYARAQVRSAERRIDPAAERGRARLENR